MPRTILALTTVLILSGCCSSRPDVSESQACKQYRQGKDEARLGWQNARDPEWPARPARQTMLRVGMTAAEVREHLGEPAEVIREEPEAKTERWVYGEGARGTLEVRFREGGVVAWRRGSRRYR